MVSKLMKYVCHINYEFEQFYFASKKLGDISNVSFSSSRKEHIPYLELFLLHTRNLYDFFCGELDENSKSIRSFEYSNCKLASSFLKDEKECINVFVSHLSKQRDTDKIWEIHEIYKEIYRCHSKFCSNLKDEYKGIIKPPEQTCNDYQSISSLDISSTVN